MRPHNVLGSKLDLDTSLPQVRSTDDNDEI